LFEYKVIVKSKILLSLLMFIACYNTIIQNNLLVSGQFVQPPLHQLNIACLNIVKRTGIKLRDAFGLASCKHGADQRHCFNYHNCPPLRYIR